MHRWKALVETFLMGTDTPIFMTLGHAVGDAKVASPSQDMQDDIFLDGINDHFALTVSCMVDPLSGSAPEDRVRTAQPDTGSTCSLGYCLLASPI